jgi:hemerythrin-like domain-containing protein
MMPIGPLMVEHRLIERMLADVRSRVTEMEATQSTDIDYLHAVVDFIRTYADRCHHGKEEDILFKELLAKNPDQVIAATTRDLISEHEWARETVGRLVQAMDAYVAGSRAALADITGSLRRLLDFYPVHIRKEDKEYFKPAMAYFTPAEQTVMLAEFQEFDRALIHEHYRQVVERLEAEEPGAGSGAPNGESAAGPGAAVEGTRP